MNRHIRLYLFIFGTILTGSALIGFVLGDTVRADGVNGPFVSEKIRNQVIDYQQLTYTLECTPGKLGQENAEFPGAKIPKGDTAFASINQLSKGKILDQGILGASHSRGDMFPNEMLPCDIGKDYGFQWSFANLGRPDLIEFYCSLPGVYHSLTGGLGRTVAGGKTKASCQSGAKLKDGVYVLAKTHSLKAESKSEFSKSKRGEVAAASLTPQKKYIQYWLTFKNTCKATITDKYPKSGDPAADNGSVYKIPVVNQDGNVVDYIANSGKTPTDGVGVYLDATRATQDMTCGQLAVGMRQTAPQYSTYLKGPGKNDSGAIGTGIPENDLGAEGVVSEETTTCAIDGIGWIVCPVSIFLAELTDSTFDILKSLLIISPKMLDTKNDIYSAWSAMRNVANVAFVISFLLIIYSQITGLGITNYGIKKLLPKIVIAAVLVNISFWICAIAVDLSNIMGSSLQDLFMGLIGANGVGAGNSLSGWGEFTAWLLAGGTVGLALTGATIGALAAGGFMAVLAGLLPLLVGALFALLTVVLVLTARQAILIILIVVSPLAFVAYLLPNTEQWYKKWQKLFFTLLVMFPVISVVFGGSQLAAAVVRGSSPSALVYVTSLGIQAIPLFITPLILKAGGGLLNAFGAKINNPNKGPFDRMRKGAEGIRDRQQTRSKTANFNSQSKYNPFARSLKRKSRIDAEHSNQESEFKRAQTGYVADLAENNEGFRNKLSKGGGEGADMRALSSAINVQAKLTADEVSAAKAVIENINMPFNQLKALASGGDAAGLSGSNESVRRAAVQSIMPKATVSDAEDIIKSLGGDDAKMKDIRQDVASGIASSGLATKATHLGGKTLDDIAQGKVTTDEHLDDAVAYHFNKGKYSSEAIAGQDGVAIQRVVKVAENGSSANGTVININQKVQVQENANQVLVDGRLNSRISSKEALQGINTISGR